MKIAKEKRTADLKKQFLRGFVAKIYIFLFADACIFFDNLRANYNHPVKFHALKEENPLIQTPEHLFLVIFSNDGFSWNLNLGNGAKKEKEKR